MIQGVGVVRHTKGSGLPGGRGVANGTPAGRCHYRWEEVITLLLALASRRSYTGGVQTASAGWAIHSSPDGTVRELAGRLGCPCPHRRQATFLQCDRIPTHMVGSGNSQPHMGTLFPHNALVRRGQRGVAGR